LRLRDAIVFGLLAIAPMAAWMARNVLTAGSATGRDLSFHPVGLSHAWQALYTVSSWLLIPPTAPDGLRFAAGLAIGGAAALGVFRCVKSSTRVPTLVAVLVIFTAVYAAFLATSISFLDANTPLDDRILLPVLAAGLVLGGYLLDVLWPLLRRVPLVAYGTLGVVMLLTGGHALRASTLAVAAREKGWGFSSEAWRQSPTLTYAAQIDAQVPLFSNAPEIVYLHTGRQVRGLPRARFLMNQQPNRAFATELAEVRDEVERSCGAIVYLRNLAQQSSASEAELQQRLALDVWRNERDGAIWGATGCRR
jgi:hypothetical protein